MPLFILVQAVQWLLEHPGLAGYLIQIQVLKDISLFLRVFYAAQQIVSAQSLKLACWSDVFRTFHCVNFKVLGKTRSNQAYYLFNMWYGYLTIAVSEHGGVIDG